MTTDWVGGVQNGQNIDYVILEWPLSEQNSKRVHKYKGDLGGLDDLGG